MSPFRIAHDFRGVNRMIRGSAEHALTLLDPDDPAYADLARIISSCEAAAALTTELHALTLANGATVDS